MTIKNNKGNEQKEVVGRNANFVLLVILENSCVFLLQFVLGVGQVFMSGDLRYILLPYDTLLVIFYQVLLSIFKIVNFVQPNRSVEMIHSYFRSIHLKGGTGFLIETQMLEGKRKCYLSLLDVH